MLLRILPAVLVMHTSAALAQAEPGALETRVFLIQIGDPDNPAARDGFSLSAWRDYVPPASLPASARQSGEQKAELVISLDAAGGVTDCVAATSHAAEPLALAGCAALRSNARFAPRYTAPGAGVASRRLLRLRTDTRSTSAWAEAESRISPSPPPPPGVYFSLDGKMDWPPVYGALPNLELGNLPEVSALAPAEVKGKRGVTGLILGIAPDGQRRCTVMEPSGDAARDSAACDIANRLTALYKAPCDLCFVARVPMLVHWAGSGSKLALPTLTARQAPRLVAAGLKAGEFGAVPPPGDRKHATLYAMVDAKGQPSGCRTVWSSGDAALDARLCDALVARGKFAGGRDIFGRASGGEISIYVRFADIFPAS